MVGKKVKICILIFVKLLQVLYSAKLNLASMPNNEASFASFLAKNEAI